MAVTPCHASEPSEIETNMSIIDFPKHVTHTLASPCRSAGAGPREYSYNGMVALCAHTQYTGHRTSMSDSMHEHRLSVHKLCKG